jgi:hypothetical protein
VDDEWNHLDIKARSLERRALAGELPGKEERVAIYTREDPDFKVHSLHVVEVARFGFFADLIDDAENDR